MRTDEQRAAMTVFRALVGGSSLRVTRDPEGWPMVPARHGRIEWFETGVLAVFTDRPRIASRLRTVGVRAHQAGDQEFRGLFAPSGVAAVAALIRCRRRRFCGRSAEALALIRPRGRKVAEPLLGTTSETKNGPKE